jgi:FkbM family methyltransferase
MLNIFNYLKRPEYVFQPRQVLRRLRRIKREPQTREIVELPWGAPVQVYLSENVGASIIYYGIFDKIVPETIWRLLDSGETGVDIGANIGQNTSALAFKAGVGGKVIAFEPHPEISEELKTNVRLWSEKLQRNLQLEYVALGETNGEAWLADGPEFDHNRGSASISAKDSGTATSRSHKVSIRRLDEYLAAPTTVGVCKIDVEGHEFGVLKGAIGALRRKAIRDIIFEDFNPKPSTVTEFLNQHGFTIFELHENWWRPRLMPMESGRALSPRKGFSYNYLATLDPERAKKRFERGGWQCLTCSRS